MRRASKQLERREMTLLLSDTLLIDYTRGEKRVFGALNVRSRTP